MSLNIDTSIIDSLIKDNEVNVSYLKTVTADVVASYTHDLDDILDKVKGNYSIIALDNDSHDNNDLRLIRRWQESPTMTIIESAYRDGRLYFGNGKIQAAFVRYLDFMR